MYLVRSVRWVMVWSFRCILFKDVIRVIINPDRKGLWPDVESFQSQITPAVFFYQRLRNDSFLLIYKHDQRGGRSQCVPFYVTVTNGWVTVTVSTLWLWIVFTLGYIRFSQDVMGLYIYRNYRQLLTLYIYKKAMVSALTMCKNNQISKLQHIFSTFRHVAHTKSSYFVCVPLYCINLNTSQMSSSLKV